MFIVCQLMLSGCAAGFDSYIMTSLNFIPEIISEVLHYGKGNNDLRNARKSQECISRVVNEITRHGKYVKRFH